MAVPNYKELMSWKTISNDPRSITTQQQQQQLKAKTKYSLKYEAKKKKRKNHELDFHICKSKRQQQQQQQQHNFMYRTLISDFAFGLAADSLIRYDMDVSMYIE
uniref:Uncharacterized protein n=1 Tax=Glossina austeni TaxID=7395 RepID=A0A1A9UZ13_GLOAU